MIKSLSCRSNRYLQTQAIRSKISTIIDLLAGGNATIAAELSGIAEQRRGKDGEVSKDSSRQAVWTNNSASKGRPLLARRAVH
jgi:hypothetical protein